MEARKSTGLLSLAVGAVLSLSCVSAQTYQAIKGRQEPVVVLVQIKQGQVAYEIESKPVAGDPVTLLNTFGKLVELRGTDTVVLIFVEVNAPLDRFETTADIAGKAGFTRFRYFAFGAKSRYMTEVKFGRSMPFSKDPPPE